jgi:GGDEF domain-containing protein
MVLGMAAAVAGTPSVALGGATAGVVAGAAGLAAGVAAAVAGRRLDAAERARDEAVEEAAGARSALDDAAVRVGRLEAALAAPKPMPDGDQLLSDPETGLPGRAYFAVNADARVEAARRHLRPVAIVLLEITEPTGLPADARFITSILKDTLRSADTACRLDGDRRFGLILEDTPENGAVWTVERFRRQLTSRATMPYVVAAGVACYPAHALDAADLRKRAIDALGAARQWRQDRIEVATPADV